MTWQEQHYLQSWADGFESLLDNYPHFLFIGIALFVLWLIGALKA